MSVNRPVSPAFTISAHRQAVATVAFSAVSGGNPLNTPATTAGTVKLH